MRHKTCRIEHRESVIFPDRLNNVGLARKVPIEGAAGHACVGGDLVESRPRVAMIVERALRQPPEAYDRSVQPVSWFCAP